jgi:hypothetical protein
MTKITAIKRIVDVLNDEAFTAKDQLFIITDVMLAFMKLNCRDGDEDDGLSPAQRAAKWFGKLDVEERGGDETGYPMDLLQ